MSNALASLYSLGEAELLLDGLLDGIDTREEDARAQWYAERELAKKLHKKYDDGQPFEYPPFDSSPYEAERDGIFEAQASIQGGIEEKVSRTLAYLKYTDALNEPAAAEAARVIALRVSRESRAKRLKQLIINYMQMANRDKLDLPLAKVWIQNNGGISPLKFTDPEDRCAGLPEDYIETRITVERIPDDAKIRFALTAGIPINRVAPTLEAPLQGLPDQFVITTPKATREIDAAAIEAAKSKGIRIVPETMTQVLRDPNDGSKGYIDVPMPAVEYGEKGVHLRHK